MSAYTRTNVHLGLVMSLGMSSAPAACAAAAMALIPLEWNGLTCVMHVRGFILGYVTKVHYACMYMYQLKHVCMYIYIYVCTYIQALACIWGKMKSSACMYVCAFIFGYVTCIYMNVHVHTFKRTCTHICIYYICINSNMYACMHTYKICTHIHI